MSFGGCRPTEHGRLVGRCLAAGQAQDPGRRRGGAGEKRVPVARIGPSQPRFEELAHYTKGDVALEHPATRPHDIEAGSLAPEHVEEPGLANAGWALDEDDLTVRSGVLHHRAERGQLRFALDERPSPVHCGTLETNVARLLGRGDEPRPEARSPHH